MFKKYKNRHRKKTKNRNNKIVYLFKHPQSFKIKFQNNRFKNNEVQFMIFIQQQYKLKVDQALKFKLNYYPQINNHKYLMKELLMKLYILFAIKNLLLLVFMHYDNYI